MLLFFVTAIALIIIFWFRRRDRNYLKKDLKEVVGDDMKKILNMPTADATFNHDLDKKLQKKSSSRTVLDEMNR